MQFTLLLGNEERDVTTLGHGTSTNPFNTLPVGAWDSGKINHLNLCIICCSLKHANKIKSSLY